MLFFVLFLLRFDVLVNIFLVMSGQSHHFQSISQYCGELMCLAQGHKPAPHVEIETRTSRFRLSESHALPAGPPTPNLFFCNNLNVSSIKSYTVALRACHQICTLKNVLQQFAFSAFSFTKTMLPGIFTTIYHS